MRIVSFNVAGRDAFGVLRGEEVIDAGARFAADVPSVVDLVTKSSDPHFRDRFANASCDFRLDEVRLRKPIPLPGKFLCVGVNYADRNAEYRDGAERPRYPSLFMRTPDSLVAHGEPILRPPESEQLDYEGEIGLVIGTAGRRIPESEAMRHVAGATCVNEGSVRDWIRHGKFNVTQGKNFDRSGAVGPWIVTADELDLTAPLTLETRVNGARRQFDTTSRLSFPFARLVSYISTFTTLHPGDMIATGTPTGAGVRLSPPQFLVPGDVVEIEVSGIGVLRNEVADES